MQRITLDEARKQLIGKCYEYVNGCGDQSHILITNICLGSDNYVYRVTGDGIRYDAFGNLIAEYNITLGSFLTIDVANGCFKRFKPLTADKYNEMLDKYKQQYKRA